MVPHLLRALLAGLALLVLITTTATAVAAQDGETTTTVRTDLETDSGGSGIDRVDVTLQTPGDRDVDSDSEGTDGDAGDSGQTCASARPTPFFRPQIDGDRIVMEIYTYCPLRLNRVTIITLDDYLARARRQSPVPAPIPRFAPAIDQHGATVVGLPTWYWTEPDLWQPVTTTASVRIERNVRVRGEVVPIDVTVTSTLVSTPTRLRLSVDGVVVDDCAGPGLPWTEANHRIVGLREPDCSHFFQDHGHVDLRLEILWESTVTIGATTETDTRPPTFTDVEATVRSYEPVVRPAD